MKLTQEQVKDLKDGTELKVVYTGSDWEEDFGKVYNVVKIGNKLYHIDAHDDIDDIEENIGLDIIAIIK